MGGGPNKQGSRKKFRNLINGGAKINGGVGIWVTALNDYTRMERTKAGCYKT